MNIIYKTACWLVGATACLGVSSCDSFLKEYSQDLAKVESWEDLDEVLLGDGYLPTGKMYVDGDGIEQTGTSYDFLHFMSDEIKHTDDHYTDIGFNYEQNMFAFYTWQQDTGVDYLMRYVGGDEDYWNDLYSRINICNMVIALIDEQPAHSPVDETQKNRVKGEALFLRAYYYFTLANLYCEPYAPSTASSAPGMPLKFSEFVEDKEFERATLADTYAKILEDLGDAAGLLDGVARKSLYRADHTAVDLLTARVYLYMQDWSKAMEYADKVLEVNDALLNLKTISVGDPSLKASNPEMIFSMGEYFVASIFYDQRRFAPFWLISDDMEALYSRDDLRRDRYLGRSQSTKTYPVLRKFNGQREAWGSYNEVGSVFAMRSPEAYLIKAEAAACAGEEGVAKSTLEKFLATRMTSGVSVTESGAELVKFIRDEKAREFILEGHRWFDLRRYTVCEPYPWSKEIVHAYNYYDDSDLSRVDWYRLEKNDGAYTLPVPRKVLNFQISLGTTQNRPSRTPFMQTGSLDGDDEGDDEEEDDEDW